MGVLLGAVVLLALAFAVTNGLHGAAGAVATSVATRALVPRVAQIVMNSTFRMFPDSAAAKGDKDKKYQPSAEAIAMAQMMRGIHF